MTDSKPGSAGGAEPPDEEREQRRNLALRALVDEMLGKVRDAQRHGTLWEPGEREQMELELAEIMARVRAEAVWRRGEAGSVSSGEEPGEPERSGGA
ncbi:MAG TPA: hypothetical protein VFS05_00665 [Gemmatimonadaceae bacterium]|nr:hypothetical protein [Gemmatimonadaceae bacterium]